jgi:hypothetical protein
LETVLRLFYHQSILQNCGPHVQSLQEKTNTLVHNVRIWHPKTTVFVQVDLLSAIVDSQGLMDVRSFSFPDSMFLGLKLDSGNVAQRETKRQ